jgi:hypothetical protein
VTNTEGEYVIVGLAPGPYTVTVNFIGFQEFTQTVNVVDGRVTHLDPRLDVAGQSERILVTATRSRGELNKSTANAPLTTSCKCCRPR